jgi:group I intron endonuclease
MEGIIYKLTSPSGKSYIGQTINPKGRYNCFLNLNKKYGGEKIDRARKKYGPENFTYEILETVINDDPNIVAEKLNELEVLYIKKYDTHNNGYNLNDGGAYNTDNDTRNKISETLCEYYINNPNPFKGRQHSIETKQILSEKMKKYYETHDSPWKNKRHTDEVRRQLSEYAKLRTKEKNHFYGKQHSDETKEKISKSNSKAVLQIDKDTNEIINEFPSIIAAEKHFGVKEHSSTIIYICKQKPKNGKMLKTWKGFKWEYKDNRNEGSTTIPKGSTIK